MVECDGLDFLRQLWAKLEGDDLFIALSMARMIWLRRNELAFSNQFTTPLILLRQVLESVDIFLVANQQKALENVAQETVCSQWTPLPPGWLKANWDAALDIGNNRMGVGIMVRDDAGSVKVAHAKSFPYINDPKVAEAIGAWQVMSLCYDRGWTSIILEGDAGNVVGALRRNAPCWKSYGQLIEATQRRITEIGQAQIQHVRREANNAAHLLAKHAVVNSIDFIWQGECPLPIQSTACY